MGICESPHSQSLINHTNGEEFREIKFVDNPQTIDLVLKCFSACHLHIRIMNLLTVFADVILKSYGGH